MEEADLTRLEVGYGLGKGNDAFAIGTEVARQAMININQHPLSALLVFASVRYDLEELLRGIHCVIGEAPVLGTTTAGEIYNGPQKESVVAAALPTIGGWRVITSS